MLIPTRQPTVAIDQATIGGGIYVPPELVDQAVRAASVLSRPSPEYKAWLKRCKKAGRQVGNKPDEAYTTAGQLFGGPYDGWWWLPRHAPVQLRQSTQALALPEAEPVGLGITLRPYQQAAVDAVLWEQSGTIVAPCGAGKTSIGAALIARVDTPALVLVHTLDLAEQWRERCQQQLGIECGLVGDGGRDIDGRRVVVATIQTLARWPWVEVYEFGLRFGLVLLDEAHHAPARTFAQVMSALSGRYRVGLTATPKRQDGLEDFLFWTCGRIVYEVQQADLEAAGFTLTPRITWVPTAFVPGHSAEDWTGLTTELAEDEDRNKLLVSTVYDRADRGARVLVLADRVSHCDELAARVDALNIPAAALTGKLTKKARAGVLEQFRSGAIRVAVATSLADEGLDVSGIDCVVLATPSRNEGRVQQRVGRALRPAPGKAQPEVVDLVDPFGAAVGCAKKRRALYRRLGWSPPPLPQMEVGRG